VVDFKIRVTVGVGKRCRATTKVADSLRLLLRISGDSRIPSDDCDFSLLAPRFLYPFWWAFERTDRRDPDVKLVAVENLVLGLVNQFVDSPPDPRAVVRLGIPNWYLTESPEPAAPTLDRQRPLFDSQQVAVGLRRRDVVRTARVGLAFSEHGRIAVPTDDYSAFEGPGTGRGPENIDAIYRLRVLGSAEVAINPDRATYGYVTEKATTERREIAGFPVFLEATAASYRLVLLGNAAEVFHPRGVAENHVGHSATHSVDRPSAL